MSTNSVSKGRACRSGLHLLLPVFTLLLAIVLPVRADYITLDEKEVFGETRWGALPYFFSTDSLGTAIGAGAFISGVHQPQSSLVGTAFITDNDSWLVAGALRNFRFDDLERWFFNFYLQGSHFTDQRFYESPGRTTEPRAGSNDSSKDDFISGISNDLHLEFTARYVLPIGAGRDNPLTVYRTRKGMRLSPPQGGRTWNPLESGKTVIGTRYFYRYRDLKELNEEDKVTANTNGIEIWLDHDNTDFLPNPTFGSRQKLTIIRDFGWFDSANSWTNLQLDLSKYFDLGTSDWFRQQVLALNFWTSNTPTWDYDPKTGYTDHRPPPGFGSELGGYDRMRGYPLGRFHDKAAVYYGAELRLTPVVNGLDKVPLLEFFEIDWWQVAGFAEMGRVAPDWDSDLLFKDLKWDVGLSLRIMTFRQPIRLDWAISDEDWSIWAMYDQPYSR